MIAVVIYALCALTCAACSFLLWRMYERARLRLLLWCSLGFAGLTVNNVLLFADKIVFLQIDLSLSRGITALFGLAALCYGLIWYGER